MSAVRRGCVLARSATEASIITSGIAIERLAPMSSVAASMAPSPALTLKSRNAATTPSVPAPTMYGARCSPQSGTASESMP